jgi:hypothetical protein
MYPRILCEMVTDLLASKECCWRTTAVYNSSFLKVKIYKSVPKLDTKITRFGNGSDFE